LHQRRTVYRYDFTPVLRIPNEALTGANLDATSKDIYSSEIKDSLTEKISPINLKADSK
jgi:hypothetical protein